MIVTPTSEWSEPIILDGPAILRVNTGRVIVAWNHAPQSDADGIDLAAGGEITFEPLPGQTVRLRAATTRHCRVFIGPWRSKETPSASEYIAVVPVQSVAAGKKYFDIFNASSDHSVTVSKVSVVASGSVAVTGTLSVDLTASITSDIGSGGTDIAAVKADALLPNIPPAITLRAAPTGGATVGGAVGFISQFIEETNAATYMKPANTILAAPVTLHENQGLAVVQEAIGSAVGRLAFIVVFSISGEPQ